MCMVHRTLRYADKAENQKNKYLQEMCAFGQYTGEYR